MARILIVDDEAPIRAMLREMLAQDGHDVTEAENGAMALARLRAGAFDLLITDLVMPEKNGLNLILDIRKEWPDLEIVAISGGGGITGRFEYLPIAKLVGAGRVLAKPFDKAQLQSVVREALAA